MSDKRACSATVFGPRVHSWQCSRTATVERDGKWYCRQHDPEAKKARREKSNASFAAKSRADDVIHGEASAIAGMLGVEGHAYYSHFGPLSNHGPKRYLVISFDDCFKLVERLRDAERAVSTAASEA